MKRVFSRKMAVFKSITAQPRGRNAERVQPPHHLDSGCRHPDLVLVIWSGRKCWPKLGHHLLECMFPGLFWSFCGVARLIEQSRKSKPTLDFGLRCTLRFRRIVAVKFQGFPLYLEQIRVLIMLCWRGLLLDYERYAVSSSLRTALPLTARVQYDSHIPLDSTPVMIRRIHE
jgi:hypothetical protein